MFVAAEPVPVDALSGTSAQSAVDSVRVSCIAGRARIGAQAGLTERMPEEASGTSGPVECQVESGRKQIGAPARTRAPDLRCRSVAPVSAQVSLLRDTWG